MTPTSKHDGYGHIGPKDARFGVSGRCLICDASVDDLAACLPDTGNVEWEVAIAAAARAVRA